MDVIWEAIGFSSEASGATWYDLIWLDFQRSSRRFPLSLVNTSSQIHVGQPCREPHMRVKM